MGEGADQSSALLSQHSESGRATDGEERSGKKEFSALINNFAHQNVSKTRVFENSATRYKGACRISVHSLRLRCRRMLLNACSRQSLTR